MPPLEARRKSRRQPESDVMTEADALRGTYPARTEPNVKGSTCGFKTRR